MHTTQLSAIRCPDLKTPVRNRFFYGKLMDVYHFDLETRYLNTKRWLLNRLVSGFGVVCGLNVEWASEPDHIVVGPGVAIDKSGREIVVPEKSAPVAIAPDLVQPMPDCDDHKDEEGYVHVVVCYHECFSDPAPVLTGECLSPEPCAPGAIRERYKVEIRPGCAPVFTPECRLPDVVGSCRLDYRELARWVTHCCPPRPEDPCIPLANIRVKHGDEKCCPGPEHIDIAVRPIVYSNDLLFDLLVCMLTEAKQPRGGKS